jgi:NAD(P)-dependent dehydrogenase (short-subunit alcohol dehydrogenase family)
MGVGNGSGFDGGKTGSAQESKVAIVAGVGEGLGLAIAERFASGGYKAILVARTVEKLERFARSIEEAGGRAAGYAVDVRNEADVVRLFEEVERDHGPVEVAVYNAGAQHRKPYLDISGDTFEKVWRLSCFGAFVFSREAVRRMLPRRTGTVLFTGATASLRGGANFGAFAAAKFGTRALAQTIAREFGPSGIHAASVMIDGAINMPAIHKLMPDFVAKAPEDGLLSPQAIAETYFQIHRQHRSAWSLEVDVRPYAERF